MEKITLKPVAKELLYKTDEVNTHVDVLSYQGISTQERALGSLYVVGQVKYGEEDLGYVLSLVSSLARREFYSEPSLKSQEPKKAFEGTLRKLNEVLEDFFKNKNLALNIGLAVISGEQIYISKLGKFKVGLARNGEFIDVLNNVALFHKSEEHEEQFSNIISGRLQTGDKIFAYFPSRPITSREKSLQTVLVRDTQDQFDQKLADLASTAENFTCCGVHIAIEQIKEIPLASLAAAKRDDAPPVSVSSESEMPAQQPQSSLQQTPSKPRVVAAEMAVARKATPLSKMAGAAGQFRNFSRLSPHMKFRGFIIAAVLVLVPIITLAIFRGHGDTGGTKEAYKNASENLKLAQSRLAQNDPKEARRFLALGLAQISTFQSKDIDVLKQQMASSLDSVDHVSSVSPQEVGSLTPEQITAINGQNILSYENNTPSIWYNDSELFTAQGKTYTLKDPASAQSSSLYEGNLYTLSANHIYKYGDVINGGTKRSDWGTNADTDDMTSIAVDGNLFALTTTGKISMYFKGKKEQEFDPGLTLSQGAQLYTAKDLPILYLANPTAHRLYVLDKTSGSLTATYKLDAIAEIKDIAVTSDGNVWLLGADNKIWSIAVQP